MLLKQKPANIRKWLLGFITLGIYTPLEARVYCSRLTGIELPIDMGNSICTAH